MTPLFSPPLESPIAETREVRPLPAPGSPIRVSHRCSPQLIGRVLAGQAYMEQLGARLRTIGVDKVVRSPPRRTPSRRVSHGCVRCSRRWRTCLRR